MTKGSNTVTSEYGLVFIHGAGLGPWIWEELTQSLDSLHLSVSYPNRGERPADKEKLGLQEYVDHVQQQVKEWDVDQVIFVAHSIGGIVCLEVASEFPERVVGFVGICATIPKSGGSFLSCYPFHQRIVQRAIMRLAGTKPPNSAIRRSLCNGLSEKQTGRVINQFTPEARRLYTDESSAVIPDVPTLYVKTTDDNELRSSLQDRMVVNLNAEEVATINSGHLPMLSNPQELAEILGRFEGVISAKTG